MRLLALLIAGLLPVSTIPLSANPAAVRHLSTAGTVWINAAALPSGSSVYNGDTVATAENGFALLSSANEGRVEIRQDTLVSVAEREVALKGGVVASDGLAVRLGADLVRPATSGVRPGASVGHLVTGAARLDDRADSRPWFVVADRDGHQLVAAYRGSVLIDRAGETPLVVPEGFYAVPSRTPDQEEDDPRPAKPDPRGNGHWAIFSLTSGTAVAFVVSLGATAVFASMVAYTLGQESVSPSN